MQDQTVQPRITFRDGNVSHPAIRFDVAMAAALSCAARMDDVQTLSLALYAYNAARALNDADRGAAALYAMQCAQNRLRATTAAAAWDHRSHD